VLHFTIAGFGVVLPIGQQFDGSSKVLKITTFTLETKIQAFTIQGTKFPVFDWLVNKIQSFFTEW